MAMADVYCLFNRARGTELVSPDDLLQAVNCFRQVGAPLQLKEFSTGVLVVQSNSHSTQQVWSQNTCKNATVQHAAPCTQTRAVVYMFYTTKLCL